MTAYQLHYTLKRTLERLEPNTIPMLLQEPLQLATRTAQWLRALKKDIKNLNWKTRGNWSSLDPNENLPLDLSI